MSTLKQRFAELARLRPEISQADLARATGAKPPSVNAWFSGDTKSMKAATASVVAGVYGVSPHWLATGQGAMLTPSIQTSKVKLSGLDPVDLFTPGGVPLVSWVQAGCWAEVHDPYVVGDAEDWLPCPVRHGPRTYCLRVRGDSMHNPDGRPSYSDGDIIFVDPDRSANHGDRVIVRLDDQAEATFKQLLIEDGRKMLKALNPGWAPRYININGNATIAGVVIGKWVPE